ncbi:MAG: hypothetical protein HFJ59_00315 [Clostridia bacterium]|nr:hypothetical protein [Clostridia bacterium]
MKMKVKSENPFMLIWNALVRTSYQQKSDIEKQVEKVKESEDSEHILNLLHIVEVPPSVKKARFNTNNIKAKVSSSNIKSEVLTNNKIVTTERIEQEEKSLDEI